VASDGGFQACLGGQDRAPLRELMRAGASDGELAEAVHGALSQKAPRHQMEEQRLVLLPMRGVGG
jgi:cyclic pyranopterin phosphate synthase